MEFAPKVNYKDFNLRLARRERNNIHREVMYLVAFFWHREFRPKHFTHAGATEYRYTERSPLYNRKKLRRFGHTYPLVFTGDSKLATEANVTIRAIATSNKARGIVKMRAPNLSRLGRDGSRTPIVAVDELRRVSDRETRQIAEVARVNTLARYRNYARLTESVQPT